MEIKILWVIHCVLLIANILVTMALIYYLMKIPGNKKLLRRNEKEIKSTYFWKLIVCIVCADVIYFIYLFKI